MKPLGASTEMTLPTRRVMSTIARSVPFILLGLGKAVPCPSSPIHLHQHQQLSESYATYCRSKGEVEGKQ